MECVLSWHGQVSDVRVRCTIDPRAEARDRQSDRGQATLLGGAIGDALGMPSQTLSAQEIRRHYGVIDGFVAPFPQHPVARGLVAAAVTDDTEQTFLLARQIIASPDHFDASRWAETLLHWQAEVRAQGLQDLLGPSTRQALDALLAGVAAEESGRRGTTNGAAMRVAPVAIATPCEPLSGLIDQVVLTSRVTHNTSEAIAAAAAVAGMISAGIDGASVSQALPVAIAAAREGARCGHAVGVGDVAARIQRVITLVEAGRTVDQIASAIGTSVASAESVPAAFALVLIAHGDPWRAGVLGANIGDDTDTIAAIAMATAAACAGLSALPSAAVERVCTVNNLDPAPLVDGLLELRRGRRPGTGETA